jgi:hypothetical protein
LLYYYINTHLPPDCTSRFFLCRASQKELRKREKDGNAREAGIGPQYHFGKNYCNLLCKQLANRVGLDHPEKQTGRSLRQLAITTMCHKLPGGMFRAASRHANAETNARYQTETDESRMARATAFHYCPREERQQNCSISPPNRENTTPVTATAMAPTNMAMQPVQQPVQQVIYMPQTPFAQQ